MSSALALQTRARQRDHDLFLVSHLEEFSLSAKISIIGPDNRQLYDKSTVDYYVRYFLIKSHGSDMNNLRKL